MPCALPPVVAPRKGREGERVERGVRAGGLTRAVRGDKGGWLTASGGSGTMLRT